MGKSITPIASHCLIKKAESSEEKTKGGIILVQPDENFKEGIVVSIGNKLDSDKEQFDKDLDVGLKVLYDSRMSIFENTEGEVLIPFNAIVAILDKSKIASSKITFFDIPAYDKIFGEVKDLWKDYQNIKSIRISSQFITPFTSIEPLFKLNHELVFESLQEVQELEYKNILAGVDKDKTEFYTQVNDDVWDGEYKFEIGKQGINFDFKKLNTDVSNLCRTLPKLLEPYADTMRSNLFKRFSAHDFSKAKRIVFTINQEIKLLGETTLNKKIKNSELMQQFLKLKNEENSKAKSLLSALSFDPDEIGRIDLNIAFNKKIGKNKYSIFMNIQAPSNDEYSLIDVTWSIIDDNPGNITERNFGEIFSEFFIKTVLQGFYHRWFKENKDMNVLTLKK